jgi:phosphonate transport system ATP-binding protein
LNHKLVPEIISGSEPIIDCCDVETAYIPTLQRSALQGINCQIQRGEFVGLLGLNGAGKSTLLRALLGLAPLQKGSIHIQGVAVTPRTLASSRQGVGMLFQRGGLIPQLSALENVLCGRLGTLTTWQTLWGFTRSDRRLALSLLAQLGLLEQAYQRTSQLSGGQRQRVAIARTLIQSPQILLVDEPTAGLDIGATQQVMEILSDLNRDRGITVIAVLHDLALVKEYAQRAIILEQGQVKYDGTCSNVSAQFSRV